MLCVACVQVSGMVVHGSELFVADSALSRVQVFATDDGTFLVRLCAPAPPARLRLAFFALVCICV